MIYFNRQRSTLSGSYFWKANLSILAAALAVYTWVYVVVPKIDKQARDSDYDFHQLQVTDMKNILNEKLFWLKKARGDSVNYKRLIETAISLVEEDFDGTEQAKSNYRIAINDADRALAIAKHKELLESIIIKAYEEASLKKPNGRILENPDLA